MNPEKREELKQDIIDILSDDQEDYDLGFGNFRETAEKILRLFESQDRISTLRGSSDDR